ncbi:MAG: phosphomevalonate kinase [Clostridiaceae bacterium]|nr:phosphomevalonate kinase [Clostridiaceae bacterium]
MKNGSLIIRVPGKLMIAGEYAVLSSGYPAIVTAVNRYLTVKISTGSKFKISDSSKISKVEWMLKSNGDVIGLDDKKHSFIKAAITVAIQYLREEGVGVSPFHIEIQNELKDIISGQKYGLGSSAACVVGIISAILAYHGIEIEKEEFLLFKLSCIAHLKAQGNGSGADIAASVYGGWISYYRYDAEWLTHRLNVTNLNLHDLVSMSWPCLSISRITLPARISFMVGWTKHSVRTSHLVNKIEAFQKENKKEYEIFLEQSKAAVMEFIRACDLNSGERILKAIHKNRTALQYLEDITGLQLETKEIIELCRIAEKYGSGKFSGAGGGDCGIAFLIDKEKIEDLKQEWLKSGIIPLELQSSMLGAAQIV